MIEVYFLGTGGGAPSLFRSLPSIYVRVSGVSILLDAGEGVQQQMQRAGLSPMGIDVIGITHLHGDHVFGLPGLLETMGLLGREKELRIIGPQELKGFLEESFRYTFFQPKFRITFTDGYENKELVIKPFDTCHIVKSMGFLVKRKDSNKLIVDKLIDLGIRDWTVMRALKEGKDVEYGGRILRHTEFVVNRRGPSIAYTGDTIPCDRVIKNVSGVEALIHDSTFMDGIDAREFGHSTSSEAAKVASAASVGALFLNHISQRYRDASPLLHEARRFFSHSFLASDLMKVVLR